MIVKLARLLKKMAVSGSAAAVDGVVPAAPIYRVVATGAKQCLRPSAADDEVVAVGLDCGSGISELELLDVGQEHLVVGIRTRARIAIESRDTAEIGDREIGAVAEEDGRVGSAAAVDGVVPAAPIYRVVATGAKQRLRPSAADDEVVAVGLDCGSGIRPFNMLADEDWGWQVTAATATSMTISDGVHTQTYGGTFSYDAAYNVSGTVTTTRYYVNGAVVYSVTRDDRIRGADADAR